MRQKLERERVRETDRQTDREGCTQKETLKNRKQEGNM